MFRFEETATLSQISVPTLVLVGKSDIATRPVASQRMRAEMPQAKLEILAPGGHLALMERNHQFAEAIREFSWTQ
ncbi:alpha/beta hydrolase [Leptolyngbya sp. NK1-12]|uniref:alpha/beta fold hydrolase n=1 Tax=Leptolyngbya sp. NK1-12 TaxID=2547451 RepID=UPI00292D05F8|nr:alpha/beta hydrolase [Leptolyngbya sp. NK1-12]